ncbi:MAG TPA: hypothetical protein VJL35_02015 [Gemmatimonadaceae bacterium]|nr:hypothetical protein [Gemmatimonadaceae bacterium]
MTTTSYRRAHTLLAIAVSLFAGCDQLSASSDKPPSEPATVNDSAEPFTPSEPADFAGSWEAVSDDGTNIETAEFAVAGDAVTGTIRSLERGYYSGRVTVTAEVQIRGTPAKGGLDLEAWPLNDGERGAGVRGRGIIRDKYLILRVGDGESSYARPGVSLVQSAEGSAAARDLAAAITGRIYSTSSQANGRGAFVGGRRQLALCSDGSISFEASDLASTGGAESVDMGSSVSRRGEWDIVLYAGLPVVRAKWSGTGSSYSLTRYFHIKPHADHSGASVDGTDLPVTGPC